MASTYNGRLLAVGSIIQAYDQSGVYCGTDTARLDTATSQAKFGYFAVYGDDPNTVGLDEGADPGEQIAFRINGRVATLVQGDDVWASEALKSVTLSADAIIAISAVSLPNDRQVVPADTATFEVRVRNDGNGIDFYGVKLQMSLAGGPGPFDWEALEPETAIYADSGEVVSVYFSIRTPSFNADTTNQVTYTVFSHNDTTVTVQGTVNCIMTLTDVNDGDELMPNSFAVEQNYPNPFNPATIIAWNLPSRSTARLDVFDILGRLIESRDLGLLPAGPGQIEFDGSELASGVYLYRFATESASVTRKMILVK